MIIKFIKYNTLDKSYFDSEQEVDLADGVFKTITYDVSEDKDPSDLHFFDCLILSNESNKHVRLIVCVRGELNIFINQQKQNNKVVTERDVEDYINLRFIETLKQIRNLYPDHKDVFDNGFLIEAINVKSFPSIDQYSKEKSNLSASDRSRRSTLAMRRNSILIYGQRYNYGHLLTMGSKSFFMKKGTSVLFSEKISDRDLGWCRPYLTSSLIYGPLSDED